MLLSFEPCSTSLFHADASGFVDKSKARWQELRARRKAAAALAAAEADGADADAAAPPGGAVGAPNRGISRLAPSGGAGGSAAPRGGASSSGAGAGLKDGGGGGGAYKMPLYTK
jgi:hypothetical protein